MRKTLNHSQENSPDRADKLPMLGYLLYTLGILFGITALIGVIVNHIKLPRITEHYARSHLLWQVFSFWILFAGIALVVFLWPAGYSKMLAYACLFWWIASALIGLGYLLRKQPIPFIKTATSN